MECIIKYLYLELLILKISSVQDSMSHLFWASPIISSANNENKGQSDRVTDPRLTGDAPDNNQSAKFRQNPKIDRVWSDEAGVEEAFDVHSACSSAQLCMTRSCHITEES